MAYTGTEQATELPLRLRNATADSDGAIFDARPARIPSDVVPIFDDAEAAIVGYRTRGSVTKYFDLNGKMVGIEEPGLESPLFDPIDLIFIGGGLFKALGKGFFRAGATKQTPKVAAALAGALSLSAIRQTIRSALTAAFRAIVSSNLKFTVTTAARMAGKGRFVPVHILKLCIKHGKRVPDPKGVKGAFQYTIKMFRNGKPYNLEVVLRESDKTVLHFMYK